MRFLFLRVMSVFILSGLFLFSLSNAKTIFAESLLFSDSFDDNDFSDWTVVRNAQWGDATKTCMFGSLPAKWEILDGRLGISISGPPCVTEIVPNGINFHSSSIYRYDFDWYFKNSTNADRNVIFIWKDISNWYDVKITSNNVMIQKIVNGTAYFLPNNSTYYPFSANQEYRFSIEKLDDQVRVYVNGTKIIDMADSAPYIDDTVTLGLQASVGALSQSYSYFDNIRVYMLDEVQPTNTPTPEPTLTPTPTTPVPPTLTPTLKPTTTPTPKPSVTNSPTVPTILTPKPNQKTSPTPTPTPIPMPHYMQTDPLWADDLYDSANIWSPGSDTMADWGCATTSLAMILRHHQITRMPTGENLTPATLNNWLTAQTDGYLGEGMLNWSAAMRLVRLIHDEYQTTKLEFSRVNNGQISSVASRINSNRPVIANIPGHFLVADQVIGNNEDLRIKDPFYNYTLISQHDSDPISYRAFTPSNTDLSYLVAMFDTNIDLRVIDPNGDDITNSVVQTEFLKNPRSVTGQNNQARQILEIPKPTPGIYQLILSSNSSNDLQTKVIGYDQLANPDFADISATISTEPTTVYLNYTKTGQVEVANATSWLSFRLLLNQLHEDGEISHPGLVKVIDRLAAEASLLPVKQQRLAKHIISLLINNIPAQFLTESARTSLVTHLSLVHVD